MQGDGQIILNITELSWEFIITVVGSYFVGMKNEIYENKPEGDTIQMIHADVLKMPHIRSPDQKRIYSRDSQTVPDEFKERRGRTDGKEEGC